MTCNICNKIKNKEGVVYASDNVAIIIPDEAITQGHLVIVPVNHYPILEAVPNDVLSEMFVVANKTGMAIFESIGAQGTNILIQNGIAAGQESPHVMLHVIPRKENDGLDFQWTPKQMNEEEMSTIELKIKEQIEINKTSEKKEGIVENKKKETIKEDYRFKSLIRIP